MYEDKFLDAWGLVEGDILLLIRNADILDSLWELLETSTSHHTHALESAKKLVHEIEHYTTKLSDKLDEMLAASKEKDQAQAREVAKRMATWEAVA